VVQASQASVAGTIRDGESGQPLGSVIVALAATESVSVPSRTYLNRLSDLLFVLARALNRVEGSPDVLWQKGRVRGEPDATP